MPDLSVQTSKLLLMSGLLHAVSLSQQLVNAPELEHTYVLPHACVQICASVLVYRGVMIYMQHLGILGADWSKRASIERYVLWYNDTALQISFKSLYTFSVLLFGRVWVKKASQKSVSLEMKPAFYTGGSWPIWWVFHSYSVKHTS